MTSQPETAEQFGCPMILTPAAQKLRLSTSDPLTCESVVIEADEAINPPDPIKLCALSIIEIQGGSGRRFCDACQRMVSQQVIPPTP